MSAALDELQRDYRAMLRHGVVPTGLLIDQATLAAIILDARPDDPRLQWGQSGLDRLFGFRPQVTEVAAPTFTGPSRPPPRPERAKAFTLGELRAL